MTAGDLRTRCPRCGAAFTCGANRGACACFAVPLDDAQRTAPAQRYTGCLCLNCLRDLTNSARAGAPESAPG